MAQLEKFIKVTQEQYNTLQNGGTVGSHTGINPNFIYLVENNGSSEGGTTVTPNPTLSGSETVLTGLNINGTNYRMPEVTVDETYVTDALSNFLADEVEPKLEDKQDTLVSGTNIKTINGNSILGSGDLTIEGGSGESGMNIVPITEELTWDATPITLTEERYNELLAATHVSVIWEEATIIFNATAQRTDNTIKMFMSTIVEGSLICFMIALMSDLTAGTYHLTSWQAGIPVSPTSLVSGNLPVATDNGMIEDSGLAVDDIATVEYVNNKISFIVNDDNTLDLIID